MSDTIASGRDRAPDKDGALRGVRVIDATAKLGAYCSKLLADLGADVIKVEPVAGDPMRRQPPFKDHVAGTENSLAYAYYHVNKRGITLDREHPEAAPIWEKLIKTADVVLYDSIEFRDETALAHDQQIVCTITPYGVSGPYRSMPATHLTSAAMGGAFVAEHPNSEPAAAPDLQMYDNVGGQAALAILVALRNRPAVGGQFVEVAAHEILAAKNMAIQRFMQSGHDDLPSPGDVAPPAGKWRCRDGSVEILVFQSAQWEAFRQLLGDPPELVDPALKSPHTRRKHRELIQSVVSPILAGLSKADVFERAQALRIPCAPINRLLEFVEDPQTVRRGTFADAVDHPRLGTIPAQRLFVASEPLTVLRRAAPLLGEHNLEVYAGELGFAETDIAAWGRNGLV